MLPAIYRKGQGYITRVPAAVCIGLLAFYGVIQLYSYLVGFDWGNKAIGGFAIPIVEQPLNVAFIVAAVVTIIGGTALFRFLNRPKTVDLLVDTETELRKVTWPGWPETINASVVVVIALIIISLYLAAVDFVLSRFFGVIL
ncbi:MAG: protein translocase subunit SecE [Gemmatimonadota bacterium]|nr:MAG: protein translocase subunit SecE [Gemmatimonadota bacterium]